MSLFQELVRAHEEGHDNVALMVPVSFGNRCSDITNAVRLLRARGFSARPLQGGLPDWRLAGLPVSARASA